MMYYSIDEKIKVGDFFVVKLEDLFCANIKNFDLRDFNDSEMADYPSKVMFSDRFGSMISTHELYFNLNKEQILILMYIGDNKCIDIVSQNVVNIVSHGDYVPSSDLFFNSSRNYYDFMMCYKEVLKNPLCISLDESHKPLYCDDYYKEVLFKYHSPEEITKTLNDNVLIAQKNLKDQMDENINFAYNYALTENTILSLKKIVNI